MRRPRPWESEQAAFSFLLRVLAVFAALVAILLILRAIT
jgi:hypothetical protein